MLYMSRKKADANLLDMPGVPAAPKSPFAADAGAATLKPATTQQKLPVSAEPVTQPRQSQYEVGPLPGSRLPRNIRLPPIPLPVNRPELPGRASGVAAATAATAAVAPGFRPASPLLSKPPVQFTGAPGDPAEMRQQQQRYNRLLERQRQRATEAAADTPYFPGLNDFLGFERTDPRTGQRVHTTPAELGQDQKGGPGAVVAGLAGIPMLAVNTLPLLAGNADPFATSARDVVAPLNHYLGTDIGHNWKTDATVSSAYEPEDAAIRESFTRSKSSPTTPGFFSSPYDPLAQTYKPSVTNAASAMSRAFADDQTNGASKLQRILAGTHSTAVGNSGNAIAALTPAKAMQTVAGAPAMLSNPMVAGAITQGGAALADPAVTGSASQRGIYSLAKGLEGAYGPLSANPLLAATQEVANQFGAQDVANAAGRYIRNSSWGNPDSGMLQRTLAHGAAGAVEGLPTTLPAVLTGGPGLLRGSRDAVQKGLYNAGNYIAGTAAAGGVQGAANVVPPMSDKPVLAQADDAVTANLWDMHKQEQRANPTVGDNTGAMSELLRRQQVQDATAAAEPAIQSAKPSQPAQQPQFDPLTVLPNGPQVQQYVEQNPEMAAKMQETATNSLTAAAATPEGKQELAQLQQTGDLSPKANETVKYNLLNEGFDAEKIGEWYGNLGGAEKFALWGGVSMTVLGLMHAMNGGGVGSMLAALLGLGTVGLTAGQSGLFGGGAQEQSQKITKPIGSAVTGGLTAVASKALSNPAILKAVAPYFDHLPDSALQTMQEHMRQSTDPEMMKKVEGLNTVAGQGLMGGINTMFGNPARPRALQQLTEAGFTPQTANRFVDLWAKQQ